VPLRRDECAPVNARADVVVTTVRLDEKHYQWLRRMAFRRALDKGGRPDASRIVGELIEAAMAVEGRKRREEP
jgi:hypothetical protein